MKSMLLIVVDCETEEEASQHAADLRALGNHITHTEGSLMLTVEVPDDYVRVYIPQLHDAGYKFSTHVNTYEQKVELNGNIVATASLGSHEIVLKAFRHMLENGVPKTK